MEERIATIEGTMVQMDKRLNHFESELEGIRGEIRELRKEMNDLRKEVMTEIGNLRKEMTTNFRWTMGILFTMWITLTGLILAMR
jgi:predicted  nucleic acid-binding Zn-ribbon protein